MPTWLTWKAVKGALSFSVPALMLLALWVQGQRMHAWQALAQARGRALDQMESLQAEQNRRIIA